MKKRKLIYQVYPTAIGSLRDITDKIPLIAKLQPDYIWLSPIFQSPWVDGGYDVSDYCKIDPRFGNMADFNKLVATAKKYNIGILMDLVLNHTSSEHPWFKKSERHDPWYKDYYVWLDKPLNWDSFFGGPAFDYNPNRGKYYLHLYDRTQPDLNFSNPRVVKEFKDIIKFWTDHGVVGFRVDSANVLAEDALKSGILPRISGFFNYYQTKETVAILEKLLSSSKIFTIAEPIGGEFMSHARFRELTRKAFDAAFNVGTLDVADTFLSIKDRFYPLNYRKWFRKLAKWSQEEKFSLAIESHDTPRAPSRFNADPKVLAMMQFLLPSNFPCIYQGQEIGTPNADLSNNINDYPGVQSRMIYRRLRKEGKTKAQAMKQVKLSSRDNARQPIDWGEYMLQEGDEDSVLLFYRKLTQLWRTDPVLINGNLKVKKTSRKGIFDFERRYGKEKYFIHLDFCGRTKSYCKNSKGETIIGCR
ncbi:hypothetical protein J5500_03290 [Candidatus Saccharibacteria bacterium]|nr:hypothetical protein [Candidatus Saccharibacteria bacterium]